jgi:subtilisin family serine protease
MSKKILIFLAALLLMVMLPLRSASAKTLTIAVIDTGIDYRLPNLCKSGHKSFVEDSPNPLQDDNGHGSHVAGLISKNAGIGDYCLVAIKYYGVDAGPVSDVDRMRKALQYALNIKVDFINISAGGPEWDAVEYSLIESALNRGIKIIAAAGNDGVDLGDHRSLHDGTDDQCAYFPACYDKRIVTVGNLQRNLLSTPDSNYGIYVKRWEVGTNVESTLPGGKMGYMTGTSQAAGVATGKLVRERLDSGR